MPHVRLKPNFTLDQARLDELKRVVPEAFADGKINWETLRGALGQHLEEEGERAEHFGLNWPGKRKARQIAFTPNTGTLVPAKGEGINEDETQNIFIEGENLEVLKLLQKSYAGRVKMIYIDPPYNTGNDFIYPDNFTAPLDTYLKLTGQKDGSGEILTTNVESSGRFHSTWLSMMLPRLFVARQMLREDGVIFVSIDDCEVHNLRLLMNEVFGGENFVAEFVWKRKAGGGDDSGHVAVEHEYILCFARSYAHAKLGLIKHESPSMTAKYNRVENNRRYYLERLDKTSLTYNKSMDFEIRCPDGTKIRPPQPDPKHPSTIWRWGKETVEQRFPELIFEKEKKTGEWRIYTKTWESLEGVTPRSLLVETEHGRNRDGTQEIAEILAPNIFPNPKPLKLLRHLISIGAPAKNDLVLDFFAGSGSTAHAVLESNAESGVSRTFIAIQMPTPTAEDSPAFKAGLKTIAAIGKERIRSAIKTLSKKPENKATDLGFMSLKLVPSNFRVWQDYSGGDIRQLESLFDGHKDPLRDGWKKRDLLTEILLHEGVQLTAPIRKDAAIKKNDILVVQSNDRRLLICLDDKLYADSLEAITLGESDTLICLDSALTDEQKLRMADKGLLKTI